MLEQRTIQAALDDAFPELGVRVQVNEDEDHCCVAIFCRGMWAPMPFTFALLDLARGIANGFDINQDVADSLINILEANRTNIYRRAMAPHSPN